jgi:hypothetical protein
MLDWHGAAFKSLIIHTWKKSTQPFTFFFVILRAIWISPIFSVLFIIFLYVLSTRNQRIFFVCLFLLIDCLVKRWDIHCGYHLSTGQLTCHSRPILCPTLAVPAVPVDWNTHTHGKFSLCCSWLFCMDHLIVYPGPNGYQEDENISRPVRNRLVMIVIIM